MIKPDVVDKVIGAGTYKRYQYVLDAFIEEQTRAYDNEKRYSAPWASSLRAQLQGDLAFADKVSDDYIAFLERASSGATVDIREGEKIIGVFTMAISVLKCVNDVLDDIWDLGIATAFVSLYAVSVEAEAKAVQALLAKLQKELEKAKREVVEAYAQTAFNTAISVALLCSGPVGWLGLAGIGLVQIVVDTYVGPSTSDAATWGSRGNTAAGVAAGSAEKYLQATSKVVKVAKPAGKIIPVVGFVFDVNEIAVGYKNVDGLKKLMADTKAAHEKLVEKAGRVKLVLTDLIAKINKLHDEVKKRGNGWTAQTRETLEDEMRRSGYRPRL